jgi:hypothetical protein
MTIILQEATGDTVVCDTCGENWTDRPESGGFLFHSKAVCPACEPRQMKMILGYHEENFIRGYCPKDLSFADWVRRLRYASGSDQIIIYTS